MMGPAQGKNKENEASSPQQSRESLEKRFRFWRRITFGLAAVLFLGPLIFSVMGANLHFEFLMKKEDGFLQSFLALLQKSETDKVLPLLDSELESGGDERVARWERIILTMGNLQGSHLVSFTKEWKNGLRTMFYYLDFEKGSEVLALQIHPEGENFIVDRFALQPVGMSYSEAWVFDFGNHPLIQYVFLLLGATLFLWNAEALLECLFIPLNRKWLWVLFILVGFGGISMNWIQASSLDTSFHLELLGLHLPVAGIFKNNLFDPWRVRLSFPLGMIVFYFLKPRLGKWEHPVKPFFV